jgi:serine/threonine protein kinase
MGTTREELTTGSTFAGRYQVIEELGQGGMGKVYKVHDTKIGEKIALKLIRPEAGLDKKSLERPFLLGKHVYWRACIASLLGEKERAVALLREFFSQGRSYRVGLHRDIALEPLWDYQPFKELLRPKG